MPIELVSLGMSFFFLNQPFFSTQQPSEFPSLSNLPHFPESPTSVQKFKPGYIYRRHTPPTSDPPTSLIEVPPHLPTTSNSILPISNDPTPLRRSSRPQKPPERCGFSTPVVMSSTLSSISIPTCYTQAMEHECWKKAMEHLRKIILGTLFLVLQMLSPLVVSGSIL